MSSRSYFVTVNEGAPVEVELDGVGNDTTGAPDLDQIALA